MKRLISVCVFFILLGISFESQARTIFIRPDGSNPTNCTGNTDAAYPGSGTGQACGYSHPNWVFPVSGNSAAGAASDGDTVVIKSSSYRIGCQGTASCRDSNVNLTTGPCDGNNPGLCYMGAVPNNVTVIGCSTTGCGCSYNATTRATTCTTTRPELWGAGSPNGDHGGFDMAVIRVPFTSNVTIADLDITDHGTGDWLGAFNTCAAGVNSLCMNWGIYQRGAGNLTLRNLNIHGLKYGAIEGGYIGSGGVAYRNVRVYGNSFAGIDFANNCIHNPVCGSQPGTPLVFDRVSVTYSGCVENYPAVGTIKTGSCFEKGSVGGGYGDGVGNDSTSGNWSITDSEFSYNTSDGFDLLYTDSSGASGASVTVKRNVFEGNVGACFKTLANLTFEDNVCIGTYQYWFGNSLAVNNGSNFEWNRGNTALQFGYESGTSSSAPIKIINNTIMGNFRVLIAMQSNGATANSAVWTIKNNNIIGGYGFDTGNPTSLFYAYSAVSGGNFPGTFTIDFSNNICGTVLSSSTLPVPCTGATNKNEAVSSTFTGSVPLGVSGQTYNTSGYWSGTGLISNLRLKSTSQSINNATTSASGADALDFYSFNRGATWDTGAIEFDSTVNAGPICGDNVKNGNDFCDGTDLKDANGVQQTCELQGYTSHTGSGLACNANCGSYNFANCVTNLCGNDALNGTEQCDTNQLNGQTCASQGFDTCHGTLTCSASCTFNTSTCVAKSCGNGCLDSGEACEDSNTTNLDGCSSRCEPEGVNLEQFLTYTTGNPSSYFDIHTNQLVINAAQTNSNTYIRKDFTASYFGDFTHDFTVTINGCTNSGSNRGGVGLWALSASPYTDLSALETAVDGLDFSLSCLSSSAQYTWQLYSAEGATAVDTYNDVIPVITRYVRIQRSGTALTAKLYSDPNYTTLLHTLSITVPTTAYRYLYPGIIYNAGTTGMSFSGEILNFKTVGGSSAPPAGPPPSSFGCQSTGTTTRGGTYR